MKDLAEVFRNLKGKEVLLLAHKNADPDSFCSSLSLFKGLKEIGIETRIGAVESVGSLSKTILEKSGADLEIDPELDSDAVVLLDVSSEGPLGDYFEKLNSSDIYKIIIDHHPSPEEPLEADKKFIDTSSNSTVELVFDLLKELDVNLNEELAFAIIYAMVAETRHLRYAKLKNFKILAELLEKYDINFSDVLSALNTPLDISERIARLKAVKRVKFKKVSGYIIARSKVGSFEASAARALRRAGADVAVVLSEKKDEVRLSLRATSKFSNETGIDFGKGPIQKIGKILGGSGGGHPTAAGANGVKKGKEREVFNYIVDLVKERTASNS